jgi:hypothetical protein
MKQSKKENASKGQQQDDSTISSSSAMPPKPNQNKSKQNVPQGNTVETSKSPVTNQVYRLALFDHLPRKQISKDPDCIEEDKILHPGIIQLALLYNRGEIQNDDDRSQSLLGTLIRVISDYKPPPMVNLREDLDKYISKQVNKILILF